MNWQRAPLFLGASAASSLLLLASIVLLSARVETREAVSPVEPVQAVAEVRIPDDFGRLDDLVPFQGGVAPVPTDIPAESEHSPEYREAGWVGAQSPESFTIQVLAARDEGVVKRFLAEREDRAQFVYFVFPQPEASWFVVTTGSYPSHELAVGIIENKDFGSLPARPFPRRMGVYQQALQEAAPAASAASAAPAD